MLSCMHFLMSIFNLHHVKTWCSPVFVVCFFRSFLLFSSGTFVHPTCHCPFFAIALLRSPFIGLSLLCFSALVTCVRCELQWLSLPCFSENAKETEYIGFAFCIIHIYGWTGARQTNFLLCTLLLKGWVEMRIVFNCFVHGFSPSFLCFLGSVLFLTGFTFPLFASPRFTLWFRGTSYQHFSFYLLQLMEFFSLLSRLYMSVFMLLTAVLIMFGHSLLTEMYRFCLQCNFTQLFFGFVDALEANN